LFGLIHGQVTGVAIIRISTWFFESGGVSLHSVIPVECNPYDY